MPSKEEIKRTMFSIRSLKAPGPDGFLSLLYQHSWSRVGPNIIRLVQHLFNSPHDLTCTQQTNLALIPKIIIPSTPRDYRPICFCNVNCKVISEIIANKIKPYLGNFISPIQGSYMVESKVTNNTIIAHDILYSMRQKHTHKGEQNTMTLKIDMSKGSDKVSQASILRALTQLGFNEHWTNMIHKYISSVEYSILLSGSPTGNFKASKGIK